MRTLEERGITAVCITALPHLAGSAGAARIVEGVKIPHPCGNPDLEPAQDLAVRVAVVEGALRALGSEAPRGAA